MEKDNQNEPSKSFGSSEQPELLAQAVLDAVPLCVLVLDCDLEVRFANASFYSTFRCGLQDTLGKHVYELGNGQLRLPELRMLVEGTSLEPGRLLSVDVEHVFPELGYKALRVTARRLHGHTGGELLIVLSILDVTQQKCTEDELHACEDEYRTLVEIAQDGIWMVDHSGITTFANVSMAAMLGETPDRMIGEPSFEFVFDEDRPGLRSC